MTVDRPAAPFNLFDEVTGGGVGTPFPQVDVTSARTYSNILSIRGKLGTPDVITHLHFIVFGFEGIGAGDAEVMVPAIDNEIPAWRPLWLCVLVVVMVLTNLVTGGNTSLPGALEGLRAVSVHGVDLDMIVLAANQNPLPIRAERNGPRMLSIIQRNILLR